MLSQDRIEPHAFFFVIPDDPKGQSGIQRILRRPCRVASGFRVRVFASRIYLTCAYLKAKSGKPDFARPPNDRGKSVRRK